MTIFRDAAKKTPVIDFSYYPNDSLAQLIVDAWVDDDFAKLLLNPANAKPLLADRGIFLKHPVVITEAEYYQDYSMPDPDGVVFVLPDKKRVGNCPPGKNLLETARLLMGNTPHGI